ncbi:5050_t:CDS:2 [Ambispora gerdemannii]|uniref:5050_t:CDS:1 n=1 Tax=Ambispora gerdemannii TaxID=144530 RepID=A0A9N8Z7T4_9GLOM|nr:5050_t:CDS:2 [Ambispora gerdemannii]
MHETISQAQEKINNDNTDNEQPIIFNESNNSSSNLSYGTFNSVIIASTSTSPVTSTTNLLSPYQTIDNDEQELESQSYFVNPINGCAASIGSYVPTTLYIKNEVSMARDQFSIERTFLSWLRISTSFNLIGLSIYFRFHLVPSTPTPISNFEDAYARTIGIMFIIWGILLLCWALWQYFGFQQMLAVRVMKVQNGRLNFCVAFLVGCLIFSALIVNIIFEDARPKQG